MNKITRTKFLVLFFLFFTFTLADAAKGPQYRSLRVHGMGGAFIAVADGKEALYYNPAGLNLKKRFENFEKYPDIGYMPRQRYEFRLLTASIGLPENELDYIIDVCGLPKLSTMAKNLILINLGFFRKMECKEYADEINRVQDDKENAWDVIQEDEDIAEKLNRLDHSLFDIGVQVSLLEFSMHNFGFATWANTSIVPYMSMGIFVPEGVGYESIQIDIVTQTAVAFSPVNDWSVGVGLKMAKRYIEPRNFYSIKLNNREGFGIDNFDSEELEKSLEELKDSLKEFQEYVEKDIRNKIKNPFAFFNYAIDLGLLYQLNREVRLGTSLRNVFFTELAGESITPNLSIGVAYSPMILQSNSWWARKVYFAADYTDMLDGTVTDMFLAHLNFGAEAEQIVLPSPTRNFSFWPRFAFGILGGGLGFLIGHIVGDGFDTHGYIASASLGSLAGFNIGFGGDVLRTSLGMGIEAGYFTWNIGVALSDAVVARLGSYAEERGLRTGQKEQRFYTLEVSVGF